MNIGILTKLEAKNVHSVNRIKEEIVELNHTPSHVSVKNSIIELGEGKSKILHKVNDSYRELDWDTGIIRLASGSNIGKALLFQLIAMDVPITNHPEAISMAGDKLLSAIKLVENNIPTPRTVAPFNMENKKIQKTVVDILSNEFSSPYISKTREGSGGNGVTILESHRSALSHMESKNDPSLIQRMIQPSNIDTRVFIIGGKIIASMQRHGDDKEFRTNISKKGIGNKYKLTDNQAEIALKTAEVSGLGIIGVDIMSDTNSGDFVIEYNSNPGLEIEKITGINVVRAIVKYAISLKS